MPQISRLFSSFFLMAAGAACSAGAEADGVSPFGPASASSECSAANTFCMSTLVFTPTSRVVAVNAAAIWINDSGVAHDVAFDTPEAALAVGLDAGNFRAENQTSNHRKFAAAGTYPFHCTIHGTATSGMRGTLVVQ